MIPRTLFDSEHELFRQSVRKFLESEAVPYHSKWEKNGQVDRALWNKAGEQGFLAPTVSEAYGGVGVDYRYNTIVNEEFSALGLSGIGWDLHSDIAVPYIENYGSEAQKQKYLPGSVSGDIITAIAMTEPEAGSDLQGVRTTAVKEGSNYILNGSKTFITNGQLADLVIVVARTSQEPGKNALSLFLVEAGTEGFTKGRNLEKVGLKAQDTSELFFQDVRVSEEQLLGEEGKGFIYLMQELAQERLTIAVKAVSNAMSILEQTVEYTRERKAFGKSISTFQNTQFTLATLDAELTTTRAFVDLCVHTHVQSDLDPVTAAKAKLVATELQGKVLDTCLQLHGGYGFMWEYPVGRAWCDARVQRIYGGTNEIMKLIIGRKLFEG